MNKTRLCILTTHPIQYIAPWFRALAADPALEVQVIFLREPTAQQQGHGFGTAFTWDLPLREGYASSVLDRAAGWSALPRLLSALAAQLRAARPDALLITGWNEPALIAAYPLGRLLRVPILVRGESNLLRRRERWKTLLHRVLLRQAAAALLIGKSNRDFYLASGVDAGRLYEGAYFVESERLLAMAAAQQGQREALRAAAGFGAADFVFCFVGKHVAFKRPGLLIEAAAQARARGWPAKLLFAGAGELSEELRRRCGELEVPAHFTGFLNQSQLWQAYVPADAFVLPSTVAETWGLVTNEAMLFGLPVIVSEHVGCGPDLVRDDETGYVFSGGAAELAQAMMRLMRDPGRARSMGASARKLVAEQYSMPTATRGLKQALAALAQH
ncbi:MAG: glycosyltransferase family 4 protein [Nevskia sp.]|nr:glycosyltransferase family 4 protein [Nevskia sp.]